MARSIPPAEHAGLFERFLNEAQNKALPELVGV